MSPDGWAALAACAMCLVALLGFVWRAAVTATSHELRITTLEGEHKGTAADLRAQIKELEAVINELRKAVWDLTTKLKVNAARSSQGQFADSDRPEEHR
jgi:hypothetical protein